MRTPYKSKVYTDRPPYADFDAPHKFQAIQSIILKRLLEHPNAVCSYSGGSDSDIMLHLIEAVRATYNLPPVHYVFFSTGLEMEAMRKTPRKKLTGSTERKMSFEPHIFPKQKVQRHLRRSAVELFRQGV